MADFSSVDEFAREIGRMVEDPRLYQRYHAWRIFYEANFYPYK